MQIHFSLCHPRGPRMAVLAGLWLSSVVAAAETTPPAAPAAKPAGSLVIPAYAYDRGNPRTYRPGRDLRGCGADGDLGRAIPDRGRVRHRVPRHRPVHALASITRRPRCGPPRFSSTESRWASAAARRREAGTPAGRSGKRPARCRSTRAGTRSSSSATAPFPHVVRLRFDSPVAFPPGWKFVRPGARKLTDAPAGSPAEPSAAALRLAIRDLTETFGARYPRGAEFLQRLDALEERLEAAAAESADEAQKAQGRTGRSCRARPCWPIRCWTSTSCCWSSGARIRPGSACRRTGRAIPACPRPATTTRSRSFRPCAPTAG